MLRDAESEGRWAFRSSKPKICALISPTQTHEFANANNGMISQQSVMTAKNCDDVIKWIITKCNWEPYVIFDK